MEINTDKEIISTATGTITKAPVTETTVVVATETASRIGADQDMEIIPEETGETEEEEINHGMRS